MYEATISFAGALSARRGERLELSDENLAKELLSAGYIKKIPESKKKKKKE